MQDRKGGCLCGAVRYVLKGEPRAIAICHCTHCQRQSGSLFSFNLVVREADYEQSGETMVYVDRGDSGQPVYRHFCGGCGSPILAKIASAPGKIVVKAGTLDRLEGLQPKTEIYTDHAVKWLAPVAGAARFCAESMTVGMGSERRGGRYRPGHAFFAFSKHQDTLALCRGNGQQVPRAAIGGLMRRARPSRR